MKVAAILPAYNEETRISEVIRAVLRSPSIEDIIVVNDGSTDRTSDIVKSFPDVRLVELKVNMGKGGAMKAGASATNAEILVFLDADLVNLRPEHVESLVMPVKCGRVKMAVGHFRCGRRLTDWAQKVTPCISGQRAIRRNVFEQIPDLEYARYGVEMAITRFCHHFRIPSEAVPIFGVTHPMKEEKLGVFRGAASRMKMYTQICRIMLDPRAPRRVRPKRIGILRKIAANARLHGNANSVPYWVYRQRKSWRRWRDTNRMKRRI